MFYKKENLSLIYASALNLHCSLHLLALAWRASLQKFSCSLHMDHDNCDWSTFKTCISTIHPPSAQWSHTDHLLWHLFSLLHCNSWCRSISYSISISFNSQSKSTQLHSPLFMFMKSLAFNRSNICRATGTCLSSSIDALYKIGHLCGLQHRRRSINLSSEYHKHCPLTSVQI